MKSLLIKFDTKRTKIFFGCAWIALVALWFFTTTDAATFQWAMQKGGITATEFGAFGKLQFMCVFQTKVATDSRRSLPPIPRESCH